MQINPDHESFSPGIKFERLADLGFLYSYVYRGRSTLDNHSFSKN